MGILHTERPMAVIVVFARINAILQTFTKDMKSTTHKILTVLFIGVVIPYLASCDRIRGSSEYSIYSDLYRYNLLNIEGFWKVADTDHNKSSRESNESTYLLLLNNIKGGYTPIIYGSSTNNRHASSETMPIPIHLIEYNNTIYTEFMGDDGFIILKTQISKDTIALSFYSNKAVKSMFFNDPTFYASDETGMLHVQGKKLLDFLSDNKDKIFPKASITLTRPAFRARLFLLEPESLTSITDHYKLPVLIISDNPRTTVTIQGRQYTPDEYGVAHIPLTLQPGDNNISLNTKTPDGIKASLNVKIDYNKHPSLDETTRLLKQMFSRGHPDPAFSSEISVGDCTLKISEAQIGKISPERPTYLRALRIKNEKLMRAIYKEKHKPIPDHTLDQLFEKRDIEVPVNTIQTIVNKKNGMIQLYARGIALENHLGSVDTGFVNRFDESSNPASFKVFVSRDENETKQFLLSLRNLLTVSKCKK